MVSGTIHLRNNHLVFTICRKLWWVPDTQVQMRPEYLQKAHSLVQETDIRTNYWNTENVP